MEGQGTGNTPDNKPTVTLEGIINSNNNQEPTQVVAPNGNEEGNVSQVDAQGNLITVPSNVSATGNQQQTTEPPASTVPAGTDVVETFEQTVAKLSNDSTLSEEDKEYKTLLLNTFKGTAIDSKGNLIDKDNNIVLNASKLQAYLENDELPFDDKGNVVNDKGEVIKTREQYLEDNSVIIPIINDIKENFGIEFPADFKPSENNQGIIDIVHESLKLVKSNAVVDFLDQVPELKAYAQHLALGGTLEDYTSSNIDYKNIDVKKLEEIAKLDLIKKSFVAQGNPNPDQIVEILKKAGEEDINKATASAIMFLDAKQTETNASRDAELKETQRTQQVTTENYWKDVNSVITKGAIGNIQIPINQRQAFFDYMSKPVNEQGLSQEAIDASKEGIENDLLISYLRFNKGSIDKLATQIAREQKVVTLQSRFQKLKGLSSQTGVPDKGNRNNQNNNGNLSLEGLLGNRRQ